MPQGFNGVASGVIVKALIAEIETDDCQTLKVELLHQFIGDHQPLWHLNFRFNLSYLEHSDRSCRIKRLATMLSNHHDC